MIADLAVKLDRLQSELHDMRTSQSGAGGGSHGGPNSREDADVLASLFMAKLALATAFDDKLQLRCGMETFRANWKGE
jgi:hypothetical protein